MKVAGLFLAAAVVSAYARQDVDVPEYPLDAQKADLDDLCGQMAFMPGCSLMRACQSDAHKSDEKHCATLALVGDICTTDMPRMASCGRYNASCVPAQGPPLQQCQQHAPMSALPSTRTVKGAVKGICDSHYMEACAQCKPGACPDPLSTLADLCREMPDMLQCRPWKLLCAEGNLAGWPEYCSAGDGTAPPVMRMYFHTGLLDYVLFYEWVPRNSTQYAFTLLAIFLFGVLYEAVVTYRARREHAWQQLASLSINDDSRPLLSPSSSAAPKHFRSQPFRLSIDLTRMFLQAIETTLSYALMLIAMSFNVGMFVAVVAGIAFGTFLFARHRQFQVRACC